MKYSKVLYLPAALLAIAFAASLTSCHDADERQEPVTDPATHALTHEDSLRLGLILQADTAWAGTDDHGF